MRKAAHEFSKVEFVFPSSATSSRARLIPPVPLATLQECAQCWLSDAEYQQQSEHTLVGKRDAMSKLAWFLREIKATECGTSELRRFLTYIANGHTKPGGRWG